MRTLLVVAVTALVVLCCGVGTACALTPHVTTRITNGTKTNPATFTANWSFLVALGQASRVTEYDAQDCGASAISARYVVTAAHCVVERNELTKERQRQAPTALTVIAGTETLSPSTLRPEHVVPIDAIYVHPAYVYERDQWDVAVLRTTRPLPPGVTFIKPMTYGETTALGIGTNIVDAEAAGWGDLDPSTDTCCFPTILQTAHVPIRPDNVCTINAERIALSYLPKYQLCAGGTRVPGQRFGTDTCQGDSGGPLVVRVPDGPRLAGITSRGVGCGQGWFGQYTRTSAVRDWIAAIPGAIDGDARAPIAGPDGVGAPGSGYWKMRFDGKVGARWLAPSIGPRPVAYSIWLRIGRPALAIDAYAGRVTRPAAAFTVPKMVRGKPFKVIVRAIGPKGEGPGTLLARRR